MKIPEWLNGNAYTDFLELMRLTRINETTFESASPAYSPGGFTRAYGGHVFAQAAYAAAHTVKKGFVLHSITGWFTLQGDTTKPFTYHVTTIREGGGYCQRQISVTQNPTMGIVFMATASFKRPEPSVNTRTPHLAPYKTYASVLKGTSPEDHPECPGIDSPYWRKVEADRGFVDPFPGLTTRKVDMKAMNDARDTLGKRQLLWYRVIGRMPSALEDANIHACAHLYASDRNGLFLIPNHLDLGDNYLAIASLNHTVIFHQEGEGLSMADEKSRQPHWFLSEEKIDTISHGRALAVWRLWREDGVHIASAFQDGMLRMTVDGQTGGAAKAFEVMNAGNVEERLDRDKRSKEKL